MTSQAGDHHLLFAFWVGKFQELDRLWTHVPWSCWFPFLIKGFSENIVVTPGKTQVTTVARVVDQIADLPAGWTIAVVAVVDVLMMACRGLLAGQVTLGWFRFPRSSTGNLNNGASAATLEIRPQIAWVTGSRVTHRLALVLGAAKGFSAHLVTRRAPAIAAFAVAQVQFAVTQLLAFGLTPERFAATDLTHLEATGAALLYNFLAFTARSFVASVQALVFPTVKHLLTGIATRIQLS